MTYKIGDRVKFKNPAGWPHSGTVTALGSDYYAQPPYNRCQTVQVRWDVKSSMFVDRDYWTDICIVPSDDKYSGPISQWIRR